MFFYLEQLPLHFGESSHRCVDNGGAGVGGRVKGGGKGCAADKACFSVPWMELKQLTPMHVCLELSFHNEEM